MSADKKILTCREFTEMCGIKLSKAAFMGFARSTGYYARSKGVQAEPKRFVDHVNNFGEEIYTSHNAYPLWVWRESFLRYAPRKLAYTVEQFSELFSKPQ